MLNSAILALEAEITPKNTAYVAGRVVGGLQTLRTVHGFAGLLVQSIAIMDNQTIGAGFNIHIFDQPPVIYADDAIFLPDYAEIRKQSFQTVIAPADYSTIGTTRIAHTENLERLVPSGQLYMYLVTTGAPTFPVGSRIYYRVFILG
jgi:hypothetical protein